MSERATAEPDIWVLVFTCEDRIGITHGVSGALLAIGANIVEAQQFSDRDTGRFFMRIAFEGTDQPLARAGIAAAIEPVAARSALAWRLTRRSERKRVLMLVSRWDHCLGDLLYRMRIGELAMTVTGIVSNHPKERQNLTTFGDIPYHFLPVDPADKPRQAAAVAAVIEATKPDLVVLARYMQILPPAIVDGLTGRCINIHHSFLPGFKGARPYHQAHGRGVKMIGATAHFVTRDLDEGPIIAQDVEQISHADSAEDLIRKGRGIEQRVLARAVAHFLDDRILLNGDRTVVFG